MSSQGTGSSNRDRGGPQDPRVPEMIQELLEQVVIPPLLFGCGYTETDLEAPKIGIANTWTDLNPGHVHLNRISDRVREGIRRAGMTPFGFNTIAPCDGMANGHAGMHYVLPAREVIADSVEIMARVNRLDGMVLIGSCDKIVPGLLMAAARVDIPSIILTGGYHLPYCCPDQDFAEEKEFAHYEIGKFFFAKNAGKISEEQFRKALRGIVTGPGACPMIGTAITMQCMTEALGMALPSSSILMAESREKLDFAARTGEALKFLIENCITPSKIMTAQAFRNAITVLHTMGGSTNGFLHLPAIANELDIRLPIDLFDELSERTPQTCAVKPNGLRAINVIDEAGGMPAVMKNIAPLLDPDVLTVSGRSLGEVLSEAAIKDRTVIRPMDDPVRPDGGLAVLRGNLAPNGAIVKKSAVPPHLFTYRGPARVFECEEDAVYSMFYGHVKQGECIIIRCEGPKGGPGMREMALPAHLLQLLGLGESGALVTDGRYSGSNYGICVGHVSPEAAEGGPLAVVQDGDRIEIDIPGRSIRLDIPDEELRKRLAEWRPPPPRHRKGILSWYARNVTSGDKGAVLRPPADPSRG